MSATLHADVIPAAGANFILGAVGSGWNGAVDLFIVVGINNSIAPVIFSDFGSAQIRNGLDDGVCTLNKQPGANKFTATYTLSGFGVAGDTIYVGLFVGFPSGSSPVLALAGPFTNLA